MSKGDRTWADEYTLLCERCGYVIEGLATDGACPECGKPIAESLPERRVGTPWQRKPTFRNLVRTWWMTLRHPLETLDTVEIRTDRGWTLLEATSLPSGLLLAFVVVADAVVNRVDSTVGNFGPIPEEFLLILIGLPVMSLGGMALFVIFAGVESRGLRFFGGRRGYRITRQVAQVICGHGAIGWLIASGGAAAAAMLVRIADVPVFAVLVGFLPGFLFFETFAYLGLRRCKFANRARPATAESVGPRKPTSMQDDA